MGVGVDVWVGGWVDVWGLRDMVERCVCVCVCVCVCGCVCVCVCV